MGSTHHNKPQANGILREAKSIILTILAPTSIFLLAQAGTADPAFSSSIFSGAQTGDTCAIIIFAIWSLAFSIGGWYILVDQRTFGLKKFVRKNTFAIYILFFASIVLSILFLNSVLTDICI